MSTLRIYSIEPYFLPVHTIRHRMAGAAIVRINHLDSDGKVHSHIYRTPCAQGTYEDAKQVIASFTDAYRFRSMALDILAETRSPAEAQRSTPLDRVIALEVLLPRLSFPKTDGFRMLSILEAYEVLHEASLRTRVVIGYAGSAGAAGETGWHWAWGINATPERDDGRLMVADFDNERRTVTIEPDTVGIAVTYNVFPNALLDDLRAMARRSDDVVTKRVESASRLVLAPDQPLTLSWPYPVTFSADNGLTITLPAHTPITATRNSQ